MNKADESLAPLKDTVRDLLREKTLEGCRETLNALLCSLLEQAYFAGIVDISEQRIKELERAKP